MTKPPFQNMLSLLYFVLRTMMWGVRCVVWEFTSGSWSAKPSATHWPGRQTGVRGVWNSFPSASGTSLTCGADAAFGLWQCEWQDGAKPSPYLAREKFASLHTL